ncbi:MAG: hypothetical protein NTV24_05240 [Candidatus Woesebacteria bacterium]|nr:hypothetical protein [Candidatus Woesebacteria bacterium]
MKKDLVESLRHMQSNPTTGLPHNQHVISTQVETIFAIDNLNEQIKRLTKTVEQNEIQSQKLEKSNINLQLIMVVLTFITAIIAVFPIFLFIFNNLIFPIASKLLNVAVIPLTISVLIASMLSIITSWLVSRYKKRFADIIRISDNVDIVLRDKDGRTKEIRSN